MGQFRTPNLFNFVSGTPAVCFVCRLKLVNERIYVLKHFMVKPFFEVDPTRHFRGEFINAMPINFPINT